MSSENPSGQAELKRPCAAERLSHGDLKVPFARCADGVARHVTAVCQPAPGPFHCLDCGEVLSLRRPRSKRDHFAHRPASQCPGETALHRYAKELLERTKTLTVPELRLEKEGFTEVVCRAGTYDFETIWVERALGTFQPDAIAHHRDTKLAVEFLVSHAVDGVKRAKVMEAGLSMIEIDLSRIRAGQLDGAALDQAILHTSPRRWIHRRRRADSARKLADQVAAKQVARGKRLRAHIRRTRLALIPADWCDEATQAVGEAGLDHLVGLDVACGHWFAVPPEIWQAAALGVHVIKPCELYSPGSDVHVKGQWPNERALANKLPLWMVRTDLSDYGTERLAEAGYDRSSFGSPDQAVWNYMAELARRGAAVIWSGEDRAFRVEPSLHGRLHRRVELRRRVMDLFEAVEHKDPEEEYARWASSYAVANTNPASLIETGGSGYAALASRISAIQAMARGYGGKVTDDLCGLPLEFLRDRQIERISAGEAERARKVQAAEVRRRNHLQNLASDMLEEEAPVWLAQIVEGEATNILGGSRPIDYCDNEPSLNQVLSLLPKHR